jgi:glyoxylase-like metal-dependent hydrolase (beta-lactamase superfamily II)
MGAAHEFDRVSAHPLEPVDQGGRGSLEGPAFARILGRHDTLPALLIEELPEDYDPSAYRLEPVRASRPVTDGDLVGRLRVLHLPGHTRGSIALLDEERRTLFSGDVIYDSRLLDELHESNRDDYRRSLQRLLALDIDTVHPGHGDSFAGDRLRELVDNYLSAGTAGHAVEPSE